MKDFLTPVGTPFSLANGPSTPNRQGLSHYFAEVHRRAAPTEGLSPQGEFTNSESLLLDKLKLAVGTCPEDAPREPRSHLEALPNEILSLILELGYFNPGRTPPNTSFRELALTISPHLRDIALQTPSLWSVIHLSPSSITEELDILPVYLERSKSHPLQVYVDSFWCSDVTDRILSHLTPHSAHLGQLAITTGNDHILQSLKTLKAPFLTALSLTFYGNQRRIALPSPIFLDTLPRLTYLRLRNIDLENIGFSLRNLQMLEIRGHGTWPTFSRLTEMLGGSTCLQRLILHVKPEQVLHQIRNPHRGATETAVTPRQEHLQLPELRIMEIFTSEWLTEEISQLAQLFECPKLQGFVMRDGVSSATETPNTIMAYSQSPNGRVGTTTTSQSLAEPWDKEITNPDSKSHSNGMLWVNRADIYHACNAMVHSVASTLTTLELHRAFFPSLTQTKEMFASLKSLKHLLIIDFTALEHLSQMAHFVPLEEVDWDAQAGSVHIPSLKQLFIDFRNANTGDYSAEQGKGVKEFIRLFDLPALSSLVLKGLTNGQWCAINGAFQQGENSLLTSLKVIGMQSTHATDHLASHQVHPSYAFPRLESLSLHGFASNSIIRPLAFGIQDTQENNTVWPNLTSIAISNDPLSSKPLLHRVLANRFENGRPIQRLFLDHGFTMNQESLEWMKEHVGLLRIVESLPSRIPTSQNGEQS